MYLTLHLKYLRYVGITEGVHVVTLPYVSSSLVDGLLNKLLFCIHRHTEHLVNKLLFFIHHHS
jgi:hypothetical protein